MSQPTADAHDFPPGGGEMGRLTRTFDWSRTPVGPVASWPQSLKTVVRILLDSRYAMWLGWGPEFTFFYNDAYARMTLGAKHPWALGRSAREVWAEIWPDIGPRAESVVRTGTATWDEGLLLFLQRSGFLEETYHTFSYSPVPDDHGGVGGMLCVVTEDTERTIGERRLRTLRELAARTTAEARSAGDAARAAVRALAGNPRDLPFALVYLLDPDTRTARLAGATGLPADSPACPPVVDLTAADDRTWPLHRVRAAGQAEIVGQLAARFGPLPGGVWPEPASAAVLLPLAQPGQDRPAGYLVAGISPRRPLDDGYMGFLDLVAGHVATAVANARAYEEEKRRAEALAELDRAKTAFFSNVSHEFRTPLTLLLGPVEDILAKPDGEVGPGDRELLTVAHRNGLRLQKLVNSLLDFSRIEAGRARAAYRPTDLAALTADLASNFRSACDRAGLALWVDCPPLPEPVYVDPDMWEKVVLNLLSNAFKFTLAGEIAVTLRTAGRHAELAVRDTGTGIPADQVPHLFERFHRVEGARGRTQEGSGIGLALARELVRLHGGEVRAESEAGRGSTFTVRVPLGFAHLPADRVGADPAPAATAVGAAAFVEEALRWLPDERGAGSGERGAEDRQSEGVRSALPAPRSPQARVLLADDNADMRGYVRRLLAGRYDVTAVADGAAAVAAARANPPDLVLADVMMPGLDGFGLLRELRADPRTREVPVLLVSARAGEEARVEGLEAGADDYLTKPFSGRELLATVAAHLEVARVRREAMEAVRESEARLRAVFDATTVGVAVRAPDTRFVQVNDAYCRITGYTADELRGLDWAALTHPDDRPLMAERLADLLAGRVPSFVVEKRYLRKDGRFVCVLNNVSAVRDAAGRPRHLVAVCQDITARKRAEAWLAAEKQVLERIAAGAPLPDVLDALARQTEAQSADGMLCSVLLADEAGGRLFHGAAPSLPSAYNRAIDGLRAGPGIGSCGTAAFERRPVFVTDVAADPLWADFRHLAAEYGLAACCSTPILSGRGRLLGTIAMYYRRPHDPGPHDRQLIAQATRLAAIAIERSRAEEALRRSERNLRDFFDNAPLGLHWVGPDGIILRANRAELDMLGYAEDEYVGRHIAEFHADRDAIRDILCRLSAGETLSNYEARLRCKDGSIRHVLISSNVFWEDGRFVHTRCFTRDITERKQAEEALREADRRKDEFLATLAHELRNPLAPVRNAVELIRRAGQDAALVGRAVGMLDRQVGQMVRLIDDLLDVSRITRGKLQLRRERVELAAAVDSAVEAVRPLIESHAHTLTVDLPGDPVYLDADPVRLAQVFANFLTNAAKYTDRGGRLWLVARRDGCEVVVAVRDTGIGIAADHLPRVFEMFNQVASAVDRAQGGLGIGLGLVKGLVEMHGGTVAARSDGPGCGSEFVVRLPASADRPPAETAAGDGRPSPNGDGKKAGGRVGRADSAAT